MAAAEARVVWQRTANRCFVQEDAKRAPKLACCQSSSASKQAEAGPTAAADGPDHHAVGPTPLHRNPSYSNLSPDTRWWLHMQPNYGYRKGFTYEHINALQNEDGTVKSGVVNSTSRISESHKRKGDVSDLQRNNDCFTGGNHGAKKKAGNVKGLGGENFEEIVELGDSMDGSEMMQMDPVDYLDGKEQNEMSFDPEFGLVGIEKSEPWWRMADRDELVSLVARKSLDRVENCDLPPPQKMCHRRTPYARAGCFDNKEILRSSLNRKIRTASPSGGGTVRSQGFASSGRTQEKLGSDEASRNSYKNTADIPQDSDGEFSKAQLMEALCHSQMRAREAEKAAKKAYAEKEHIVTLFFRQASLLFAYKQWFHLLQLETLCIQFKNNDEKISTLCPLAFPWVSSSDCKDKKPVKSLHEGVKGSSGGERREQPSHDTTTYAVAFALGLSLVGAGLLLGWTVGWMLPRF